jgi:hypothetical protein
MTQASRDPVRVNAVILTISSQNILVNSIMDTDFERQQLAREAKAIVALAFRNGPIENIHAGRPCPNCTGQPGYSRITNAEMKLIMKNVVDSRGSCLRPPLDQDRKTREYESRIQFGERYTATWDEPSMPEKPPCVS